MRLIDADALKGKAWDADTRCGFVQVVDVGDIDNALTIDAVPVVRCKDCKEYIPWAGDYICGRVGSYWGNTRPDDFCSFGERSEE